MPVLAISISEKGRSCLGTALLLMNLSIAIISFITIIIGFALAILFNQQRDMLKDFNYKTLNFLIIFSGLALTVFHLFGAKLSFDCGNPTTRDRFKKLLLIFIGLTFVALVLLMVVSICTSSAIYQLTKGYEKGFTELMEAYDADKSKRMEVDLLQANNKCCGAKGYKDWIDMAWYPDEFMRPELKGKKGRGVPFTCCDPEYMGPCLHDAGENARPGYKKAGGKSFYPDGCAEIITVTLRWLLSKLSLWLILPIWLELFIMAGTKYLMTSINNSGKDLRPGHGFLIEKCPCSCLEFLECDITATIQKKKKGKD